MKKKLLKRFLVYDSYEKRRKILIMANLFFFLALFNIQLHAETLSQKTVSLNLQDASLFEMLGSIEDQTEMGFLYSESEINAAEKISVNVINEPLTEVLGNVLPELGVDFEIYESVIILTANKEENAVIESILQEQEGIKIKGKITDKDGNPLPGATVLVEGTLNGVATDADGNFTLTVAGTTSVLKVSFIGFTTQIIKVGNNTDFKIVMEEKVPELEEVVVTGYQTLTKARMTGSFTKIDTKELDRTLSFSIEDKITDGSVTGMLVGPLGITIRGVSTLNASRLPLIVLDGFPIQIDKDQFDNLDEYGDGDEFGALTRALESINPNDVESVTVLKDAAAASIWGSRAANGVIVITTKTTASQEPQIEYSSSVAWKPIPDVGKLPYASPETYFELEKGRYDAGWFDAFLTKMDIYKYNVSDYAYARYRVGQGVMDAAELTAIEQQMKTYDNRNEFSDLFLRSSLHQQYNLSMNQNTGFNNYRFSVSYDADAASTKQNDNERWVLNFTNQIKPAKWLIAYIGANINMKSEKQNGLGLRDLFYVPPHQRFLDENGDYTSMSSFQISSTSYGKHFRELASELTPYIPYDWEWNPKREFDNKDNTVRAVDLRLQAGITFKPFGEMLKFDFKYQYERGSIKTENYYNEEMWKTRHLANMFAQPDGYLPIPKGGIMDHFYSTSYSHDFQATAHFVKMFAEKHQVVALVGTEVRDQASDKSNVRRYGYDSQTLSWANQMDYHNRYSRNLYPNTPYYIESAWSTIYNYWERQDRYISLFANLGYTYNDRYDITGSWRLDQSNMFGDSPQYREVPLWSAGFAWTINKEDFFNISFINRLRLRATYGSSGNVDKSTSPYAIAQIGGSYNNTYLQLPGASYSNPANPDLRWEKTKQLNLGLEFSMLDNRINGEIEYYNKKSDDLLTTIKLNTTLGFQTALLNLGAMRNRGIEMTLSANLINTPEFRWRTQLTQSYNQNRVTRTDRGGVVVSMNNILAYDSYRLAEGKPRYYYMSIPWRGLSTEGYPQVFLMDSLNSFPTATTALYNATGYDDLQYEGPAQAPWYGSWSNVFAYKNWEFSFLCNYKFGHVYKHTSPLDVANNDLYGMAQGNFVPRYSEEWDQMWRKPGDEAITDVTKIHWEYTGTSGKSNTTWLTYPTKFGSHQYLNAAHIRLQRVTIAYSLKKESLPKAIKRLTFQLQGRNLAIITFNKYHEDPEHLPDMYGNFILATLPECTFSIKASF